MAEQRSTSRCPPGGSGHHTTFSRGSEAMQIFANHTEAYYSPPVTLVLDLSEILIDNEPLPDVEWAPTYLYAQNEHETLQNVCREYRAIKALPSEGIYYMDHDHMIRRLKAERAKVKTLVVILPDDRDNLRFYLPPSDDSDSENHDPAVERATRTEAMRNTATVVILQDVMRFAAPTAERVAIFNAGARLVLATDHGEDDGTSPEKPLALALQGTCFSKCRELVVSRNYNISHHSLTDDYSDWLNADLDRHISPFWHICPETFPKLQRVHMVADRVDVSSERDWTLHQFGRKIRQADAEGRPRPNIGIPPKECLQHGMMIPDPSKVLDPNIISAPYFGIGCTIKKVVFYNIPPSPDLPAMYMDVHQLIERVQRHMPR